MLNPLPKFQVQVDENHKLHWSKWELDRLYRYLQGRYPGKYDMIIQKHSDYQSDQQRKYYWGAVIPIIMSTQGYDYTNQDDKYEVHKDLLDKFAPVELDNGEATLVTTSKMDMKQYFNYIDDIKQWSRRELNCRIPEPDEVDYDRFLDYHYRKEIARKLK